MNPVQETGKTLGELAKDIVTADTTEAETTTPNGDLLKAHSLKVMHFRPGESSARHRGMTVAYRQQNRNVIEIATSIVHTADTFTKKVGTRIAVEAFVAGRTTFLPIPKHLKGTDLTHSLRYYFS